MLSVQDGDGTGSGVPRPAHPLARGLPGALPARDAAGAALEAAAAGAAGPGPLHAVPPGTHTTARRKAGCCKPLAHMWLRPVAVELSIVD